MARSPLQSLQATRILSERPGTVLTACKRLLRRRIHHCSVLAADGLRYLWPCNIQCECGLGLFPDNLVLKHRTFLDINGGLMVVWDLVAADHIILAFCQATGAYGGRGELAAVFCIKVATQISLPWLLDEYLAKADDVLVVICQHSVPGSFDFGSGNVI
jgi:hypothetical protein